MDWECRQVADLGSFSQARAEPVVQAELQRRQRHAFSLKLKSDPLKELL